MRNPGVLCAVLIAGLSLAVAAAELTNESLPTIKKNLDEQKAVLVDVREKSEWDDGHIEGAIFLPLSSLEDGVTEGELRSLPEDKILYVHCVVGKRALTAGAILERRGYEVRPMKPGYREMVRAGFPKAKEHTDGL